jgi:tetratricopeptide (TPR) repeat protein
MRSSGFHYRRFHLLKPPVAALGIALIFGPAAHILAAPATAPSNPSTIADDSTISALVSDLAADDAAARRKAADKLIALGAAARPAVMAAVQSDDPEIAAQARQVLLKLPWSQPDDPPPVKEILDRYTNYAPPATEPPPAPLPPPTNENRIEAVAALASLPNFQGFDALIRLIGQEPDDTVRWAIVRVLQAGDDGSHLARLRKLTPSPTDGPMSALCALACLAADSPRAMPLLQQAIQQAVAHPADNQEETDFLFGCLSDMEISARHYDAAADTLRQELKNDPPTDSQNVPVPLLKLMALQANFGPLAGLDADRKQAADFMFSTKLQYAAAQLAERQKKPREAALLRKDAFDADSNSRLGRYQTGKFLSENGWDADATAEFKAYLAMPPGDDQQDSEASEVNAHFQLADLAVRRGDDFEAAEQKKAAMSIIGGGTGAVLEQTDAAGHLWAISEDEIWAEIHWRYLRAAVARNDDAEIGEQLKQILKLSPNSEDIACDVVPLLAKRKQPEDAARLFAAAYQAAHAKLAADPTNPTMMNGLAWLDAKCHENLPEAERLATSAVTALPDSAAIIDTLAEVNFQIGKPEKAAKLETRALQLEPGDSFMTGQLARFRAAEKPAK